MIRRIEPGAVFDTQSRFDGVALELYGAKVLVVLVPQAVLADGYESEVLVIAFHIRYGRTIVLVAQDERGVPTYFGPAGIVRVLSGMPFDALTFRRYRYRKPAPKLPIPIDLPPLFWTDGTGEHRAPALDPATRNERPARAA